LDMFRAVFRALPVAATIEDKVFITHGGVGKITCDMSVRDMDTKINRFIEPRFPSPLSELLWSDPISDRFDKDGNQIKSPGGLLKNTQRGAGWMFGRDVTHHFLNKNNFDLLVRSHEVRMNGFSVDHDGRCVTVFSAPNYCDTTGNLGAVLVFQHKKSLERAEEALALQEKRAEKSEFGYSDDATWGEGEGGPNSGPAEGEGEEEEKRENVESSSDAESSSADAAGSDRGGDIVTTVMQFEAVVHPLSPAKEKGNVIDPDSLDRYK